MSNANMFSIYLKGGEVIVADRKKCRFMIYQPGHTLASFKLNSAFDIIALRDLLNDAFPVEVYKNDRVCRASQKNS